MQPQVQRVFRRCARVFVVVRVARKRARARKRDRARGCARNEGLHLAGRRNATVPEEELKISLREATPADEAFLLELYASTRNDELAALGWDDNQKQAFIKMQFVVRERTHRRADDRIIVLHERPIGRLMVDRNDATILLRDIALLPEYRNAGIGSSLIRDLMREASAVSKPIELHVVALSPAVRLYERLGFCRSESEGAYQAAYLEMKWVPATS